MKTTGNTILITGGTSGIGLELARLLCAKNAVIITGRDQSKLDQVKNDTLEIRPGLSNVLKLISRIARSFAVNMLAKANAASLARMKTQAAA